MGHAAWRKGNGFVRYSFGGQGRKNEEQEMSLQKPANYLIMKSQTSILNEYYESNKINFKGFLQV